MKRHSIPGVAEFIVSEGTRMEGASGIVVLSHDPPSAGTLDALRRQRQLRRLQRLERLSTTLALLVNIFLLAEAMG